MEIEMIETTEMPKKCPMKYIIIVARNKKFIIKYRNNLQVHQALSALPDINSDRLIPEKKYTEDDILNKQDYVTSGVSYNLFEEISRKWWFCFRF